MQIWRVEEMSNFEMSLKWKETNSEEKATSDETAVKCDFDNALRTAPRVHGKKYLNM